MSGFPEVCFGFNAVSGASKRSELKNTKHTFCKNKPGRKNLKKLDKKSEFFLNHVFGRFSVRGVQKCPLKKSGGKLNIQGSPILTAICRAPIATYKRLLLT
jgi:hypothetical protein